MTGNYSPDLFVVTTELDKKNLYFVQYDGSYWHGGHENYCVLKKDNYPSFKKRNTRHHMLREKHCRTFYSHNDQNIIHYLVYSSCELGFCR